jgi:glycosyltransferase involved in cell wall biosynthesis
MYSGKTVSVVMPAYNEEKAIEGVIKGFKALPYVDEVVVVDNNSIDKTREIALRAGAKVAEEPRIGYGYACKKALFEAEGEYVVLVESDATFSPRDLIKFLAYADDFDYVQGTRTTKELIMKSANMYFALKWGNWFVAKALQLLYNGPSLSDMGCTYRLVKREVLRKIKDDLTVGGPAFLANLTVSVLKKGVKTIEIPVNYMKRRGKSKITGSFCRAAGVCLAMVFIITVHLFKRE